MTIPMPMPMPMLPNSTPPPSRPRWQRGLRGQLLAAEPMARHTSWRTGGAAEYFYTPADKADLCSLLPALPSRMAVHYIGLGSNLLVRDGGVAGLIIRTSKGLTEFTVGAGNQIYVQAGVACARVARRAVQLQLRGVEFLAGVPGSFGGALAMNAGAFGDDTWSRVAAVELVTRDGRCATLPASEITYGYRTVQFPANFPTAGIVAGTLQLDACDDATAGSAVLRHNLAQRNRSQPVQTANAGSVFKNPIGDFAARLIEQAELKGQRCGGASISDQHANFIINDGTATAADIEQLIDFTAARVRAQFRVELRREVHIIGEAAHAC